MAYILLKKEANILMSHSSPFLKNALWLHEVGKKKEENKPGRVSSDQNTILKHRMYSNVLAKGCICFPLSFIACLFKIVIVVFNDRFLWPSGSIGSILAVVTSLKTHYTYMALT